MSENGDVRRPKTDFPVSPKLLESLVCPATGGRLEYDPARRELISRTARLAYPVREGIPVLLIDEARRLED